MGAVSHSARPWGITHAPALPRLAMGIASRWRSHPGPGPRRWETAESLLKRDVGVKESGKIIPVRRPLTLRLAFSPPLGYASSWGGRVRESTRRSHRAHRLHAAAPWPGWRAPARFARWAHRAPQRERLPLAEAGARARRGSPRGGPPGAGPAGTPGGRGSEALMEAPRTRRDVLRNALVGRGAGAHVAALRAGKRWRWRTRSVGAAALVMRRRRGRGRAAAGGQRAQRIHQDFGEPSADVRRLMLTASGGPFSWMAAEMWPPPTPPTRCAPDLGMGAKVTIDAPRWPTMRWR